METKELNQIKIKAKNLNKKINKIYDLLAETYAMNIPYSISMNGSLFPCVLDFLIDEKQFDNRDLSDLTCFAQSFLNYHNCEEPSEKEIKQFIRDNALKAIEIIKENAEIDAKDISRPIISKTKWQIIESWHNRCDNGKNILLLENTNKFRIQEIFYKIINDIKINGLGPEFPDGIPDNIKESDNKETFYLGENLSSSEYWRTIQIIKQ